jgi:hypothetical protein
MGGSWHLNRDAITWLPMEDFITNYHAADLARHICLSVTPVEQLQNWVFACTVLMNCLELPPSSLLRNDATYLA